MIKEITFGFATRDDCLDQMVPSDLRVLVAQRDSLEQQLEYVKDLVKRQNEGWGKDKAALHYLREAAQAHIEAITEWQYGEIPAKPLPDLAPTANALAAALKEQDNE